MDLTLTRKQFRPDGVFGELHDSNGDGFSCVTLEHAYDDGDGGWISKIPDGIYTCQRRLSPKFKYDVFQILKVPNCTFIEIHAGSLDENSEGCVLVGDKLFMLNEAQIILNSRLTFQKLMKMQSGLKTFQLTVETNIDFTNA